MGRPISESTLLALFLAPFLRSVTPEHPFLGEREQHIYLLETIRWAIHQLFTPYSFPKGVREMIFHISMAQVNLRKAIQRGVIPKRLRMKKYFREAVLLYGIEAHAKGEKVPRLLRHVVPSDLFPWWPKRLKRRHEDEVGGASHKSGT